MSRSAARSLALAAALATIGSGTASAATPASGGAPQWIAKPTASVIQHYYPVKAKLDTRNGKASMRCSVTAEGTLENCRVLSETPKPYGFGESLLSMAQFFRMKPHDADGNPVEGMDVTVQLSFYIK
jgi:protein TonB